MNRYKIIRGISWVLVVAVVMMNFCNCVVCRADEYEDKLAEMQNNEQQTQNMITNLEKQTKATRESINLLQEQKKQTENNVNVLKGQSDVLKSEIEGYSGKLDELDTEIEKAEGEMARVSAKIVSLNNELDEMRQVLNDKQDLLKKRIKNVYEKGGSTGMIRSILEADSFTDILTRYEYANAMIRYDRQRIAECQELKKELEAKIAEVEEREAELDAYQDDLDEKYSEIESITDEVQGKLDKTNSSLSAEKGKLQDFDKKLAELDKTMKSLESQTAAAQAQLAKQVAQRLSLKKEDTSGSYSASGSELEWLAATIQAEAGGESYTGKLAVGSVIMNRVKSSAFPNDIKSVITQNMQFASYRSGKVELIIANGPNSTCVSAAQEVLGGARVGDYLFFMTKYYADYYRIADYTMIGNHAFFYRWVTKDKQETGNVEEKKSDEDEEQQPREENTEDDSDDEEDEDDDDDSDEE
ncbi:MAG: cell wall hydrolase [Lachnospiraceae bacterium]|nr:cell wall hydrolase [Lachnospiraceae bacterium]